jgi:hypothetical protein
MTADEIRNALDFKKGTWREVKLYSDSFGVAPFVLVEIAAQLAELNERLKAKESE